MRRPVLAAAAVLALALAAAPAAQAGAPAACDRDCLVDLMNVYIDAMVVQRDPKVVPAAPGLKVTENGAPSSLGEGLWKTAKAVPYRYIFADRRTGQVGIYAVANEDGPLAIFSVRLKVVGGRITESETLVTRKGDSPAFSPETMVTPDPFWDEIVPLNRRTPRAKMIAAAAAYYDGTEQADGSKVPAAAGCWRVENGLHSYKFPSMQVNLHCKAGVHLFNFVKPIRDRRYPIVDEERGLVWAIVSMDTQPGARNPRGASLFVQEIFKVVDGRTRRMEVIMRNMPYGSPLGWPADPRP